jgi:hypothetical protein
MEKKIRIPDWFMKIIAGLAEYFKSELSEAMLRIYWEGLKDITQEQANYAGSRAVKELVFMPKVSELRNLAGINPPKPEELAEAAWGMVVYAMSAYGEMQNVSFPGPINDCIQSLGGWVSLNSKDAESLSFSRKDFKNMFQAKQAMNHWVQYPCLPGRVHHFYPDKIVQLDYPKEIKIRLKSADIKMLEAGDGK